MISKLAEISDKSTIEENVSISSFSKIHENVHIGKGTIIHSNVSIYPGTSIGENCEIFPGAVIGVIPQDLKFEGENTTVIIGNNTVIRECVTIHRGTKDKLCTKIGDNCLLMTYVHVAHDCQIGNNVILASYTGLSGHVIINDFAILEGKVAAQQFVEIGEHSFVGGASLIRKDVPPFVKAGREPLSFVGINSIGLRRRSFTDEEIGEIQDIYRVLYQRNFNNTQAINKIEIDFKVSKNRDEIIDFVKNSGRGIMRGYNQK